MFDVVFLDELWKLFLAEDRILVYMAVLIGYGMVGIVPMLLRFVLCDLVRRKRR